ncbi:MULTISPECIES: DUF2249 domain-containing protein [Halobacteriaceae]|uniref:DUF2249 domain-containing protein n=2 Tax=Halobacteriaceae TaxID=2236 RepID=A0A830FKP5_9EURY|nr:MULTISPECIES: DUF2249 domain-containing protein [Halobacteriaceae]MBP2251017.1 TusA-related sulfurtransferase [Halarchaeum solikamskense]GGL65442.1 hypothetical protein GCM10009039_24150 [Halocalculus aciditolerans]GGN21692.1 hypothetical protein GCM10009021_23810 [Halarchaeum nitratireducens]
MVDATAVDDAVSETDAPADRPRERLDARELPPPEPLTETLERLADFDDERVLVQVNDRAPQHLYPKLDDRGWAYETVETDDAVVTVVWRS